MNPSRTLLRGLQVLEAIAAEGNPTGPTRIAELVGLDKATSGRLLYTLHVAGYLEPAGAAGQYVLSSKLLQMSSNGARHGDTRRIANPYLARLTDEVHETVHLGVIEQGRVVYIDKFDPPVPIRLASAIGQSNPVNVTALGKAILAALPVSRRLEVLDSAELAVPRGREVFELDELLSELKLIEDRGFATDEEENEEGVTCVGAAIPGRKGEPVAAVSISGPTYRMSPRLDSLGEACRGVAQRISSATGA